MLPTCLRHLSPTFTSVLPPHYRHHYRHYYRQKKYADIYTDKTVSTFSVHRPTAKLITFPKLSQKRESGDWSKKQVYTLLYKGIHWKKMAGIILLNINNLSVSLCKLRHFHCASWGNFIVQVEAFSLCKLWLFHCASWGFIIKKWCSILQNETPLT